jgi:hypothetical protein
MKKPSAKICYWYAENGFEMLILTPPHVLHKPFQASFYFISLGVQHVADVVINLVLLTRCPTRQRLPMRQDRIS